MGQPGPAETESLSQLREEEGCEGEAMMDAIVVGAVVVQIILLGLLLWRYLRK